MKAYRRERNAPPVPGKSYYRPRCRLCGRPCVDSQSRAEGICGVCFREAMPRGARRSLEPWREGR